MDNDTLLEQIKIQIGTEPPEGFTLRDEANAIVAAAFRNGPIESLHAGRHSELLNDESLSRITNAEMKTLMVFACERMEELLRLKETDPAGYWLEILFASGFYCRGWDR